MKYIVTRIFIGGMLEGLTHTGVTTTKPEIGFECKNPLGGSPYRILKVQEAE